MCMYIRAERSCILKQRVLRKERDDKTPWRPTAGNKCFVARKNVIAFCAARYQKTARESKGGDVEVIETLESELGQFAMYSQVSTDSRIQAVKS